jgi:hypothetical protein
VIGLRKNMPHLVFDVKEQTLLAGHVTREWTGKLIAPHSVRLMNFVPEPTSSKPVLIGSTFHIGQGIVEVVSYEWSRSSMQLELSLGRWLNKGGRLIFFAPDIETASLDLMSGAEDVSIEVEDAEAGRTMRVGFGKILSPDVCLKIALKTQ